MKRASILVGVGCASDSASLKGAVEKARRFAARLAEYKDEVKLMTGGDGGLMRVVCEEYVRRGGETIGFIPLEDERRRPGDPRYNPHNTVPILTGITFQARSIMLVRTSHSFVILGGGAGTILEAFLAYIYSKPLIVLENTGYPSDKLKEFAEEGYLDHRRIVKAYFTESPEEAADLAYKLAKANASADSRSL